MDKGSSYSIAEENIRVAFARYGVANDVHAAAGDNLAKALQVESVGITGSPHTSGYVERLSAGDKSSLGISVKVNDLRELNEDQLRVVALEVLKGQFGAIKLADGTTLADAYDFSPKAAIESGKTHKEQLADIKALIDQAPAQTPGVIPPEVEALLLKSKLFEPSSDNIYFGGGLATDKGHVEVYFNISNKDEGELNNQTVVKNNILARKDAIIAAIQEAVNANHPGSVSSEDLAKLDLEVDVGGSENWGGRVSVRIGSKAVAPDPNQPNTGEVPVGPTALAGLSAENLHRIVRDSLLLKGPEADKVAPLLADESDVRHFLKLYAPQVPAFAEALKSDVLANSESWADQQKKAELEKRPIQPTITFDTSVDELSPQLAARNIMRIVTDLPKGVTHAQVIAAMAGKSVTQPVIGPATQKIAANDDLAAGRGAGMGAA